MNYTIQNFLENGFNILDPQNAKLELVETLRSMNRTLLVNNSLDSNPNFDIEVSDVPYDNNLAYQKLIQLEKMAQKYLEEYKDTNDLNWVSAFIEDVESVANI